MYPIASRADVIAYITGRQDGSLTELDLRSSTSGAETTDWFDDISDTLTQVLEGWQSRLDSGTYANDQAKDALEGQLAVVLHRGLKDLPAAVLTDKDFWRYCAAVLYDFIVWRQASSTTTGLFPHFGVASNGLGRECVPHRMFDRARIAWIGGTQAQDADPYALAEFGAADIWKSHLLRVLNGNAPLVARAILSEVKAGDLKTDLVRPVVRNLRRVRANVLFEVLDQDQAQLLLQREIQRTQEALRSSTSNGDEGNVGS